MKRWERSYKAVTIVAVQVRLCNRIFISTIISNFKSHFIIIKVENNIKTVIWWTEHIQFYTQLVTLSFLFSSVKRSKNFMKILGITWGTWKLINLGQNQILFLSNQFCQNGRKCGGRQDYFFSHKLLRLHLGQVCSLKIFNFF